MGNLEPLQTMLSMLKDSALSDVCLVVEGIDVPSHKAVLGEHTSQQVFICMRILYCLPPLFFR